MGVWGGLGDGVRDFLVAFLKDINRLLKQYDSEFYIIF
jgi:hypothetical protein